MNVKMAAGDRKYDMELGPLNYVICIDTAYGYKKLCLIFRRPTQFANIEWMRIITLGRKYPFLRHLVFFTSLED